MKTFKHSGDLGDIIYSLPTIKDLGGGILYLDIDGGVNDPYCAKQLKPFGGKTNFSINGYNFLYPLLKKQSYINDVKIYDGQSVDYNLNKMRFDITENSTKFNNEATLVDMNRISFNLPLYDINVPWLDCGDPIILDRKIVVARSPRYQASYVSLANWRLILQDKGIFIGIKKEHELFEWTFDIKIPFYDTNSALEVARVLMGSQQIISNSTSTLAIAVGLPKKSIIQELDKVMLLTFFKNKKEMQFI